MVWPFYNGALHPGTSSASARFPRRSAAWLPTRPPRRWTSCERDRERRGDAGRTRGGQRGAGARAVRAAFSGAGNHLVAAGAGQGPAGHVVAEAEDPRTRLTAIRNPVVVDVHGALQDVAAVRDTVVVTVLAGLAVVRNAVASQSGSWSSGMPSSSQSSMDLSKLKPVIAPDPFKVISMRTTSSTLPVSSEPTPLSPTSSMENRPKKPC